MLGTGVTLIIILSVVIVAFHTALADEQQPSQKLCSINPSETQDNGKMEFANVSLKLICL